MESSGSAGDDRVQRAVLALTLAWDRSEGLSIEAVIDEIGDRGGALRALESLRRVGLIELDGDRARPTVAARRFDELGI
jgi:hypothetical protein